MENIQVLHKENFVAKITSCCLIISMFCLPLSTALTTIFFCTATIISVLHFKISYFRTTIKYSNISRICIGIFLLYCFGSIYSSGTNKEIIHALLKNAKLLYIVLLIPICQKYSTTKYALKAFILSSILITIGILVSYILNIFNIDSPIRLIFKNHIDNSLIIILLNYYALISFLKTEITKEKIFFAGIFLLSIFVSLFINDSRTGYLLCITLLPWAIYKHSKKFSLALLTFITIIIAVKFSMTFQHKLEDTIYSIHNNTFSEQHDLRKLFYLSSFKIMKIYPILGTGTGSVLTELRKIDPPHAKLMRSNPHNEYLNFAIQFGIVGVILLLALFYICWREISKCENILLRDFCHFFILCIMIGSLANAWLTDTVTFHLFCMLMLLCMSDILNKKLTIKNT